MEEQHSLMYRPLTACVAQCREQRRKLALAHVRHRQARIRVLRAVGAFEPGRLQVRQHALSLRRRDMHLVRRVARFEPGRGADGCALAA